MKLLSLNTYCGYFFEPLMAFIEKNATDTDIFCFQELMHNDENHFHSGPFRANFFSEISKVLKDFQGIFAPVQPGVNPDGDTDENIYFGLGIFIKNKFKIQNNGDFFIVGDEQSYVKGQEKTLPFKIQYAQFIIGKKLFTICNVHGTAWPVNKLDSDERLEQSQKILSFVNKQLGEKIITGDFNLFPQTKSVTIFEEAGFRNLVKDFNISSTRGSLIKKMHPEYYAVGRVFQEFADYTFVSPGIEVKKYSVPDLPLSDHLPLILEFNI
ncbi:MAG: endonuclease/exonuclease/phosphatase family protein [Candidatus Magasanikbacteria bacterium]|nr:endonuclease/exonuclease/phosphatase family protein [Candidatus Magasanikbacteria bacterium]